MEGRALLFFLRREVFFWSRGKGRREIPRLSKYTIENEPAGANCEGVVCLQSWQRVTGTPEETAFYGRLIGQIAGPGTVVLLQGQLGAGKTVLAGGIADGLGIHQVVRSPSFSLLHLYEGRLPFYHLDLYRLSEPGELSELGVEDYLYGPGVCAVEWPEHLGPFWPAEYLAVHLVVVNERERQLLFQAEGEGHRRLLAELVARSGEKAERC